jgi:hypothetical protein
VKVESGGLFCRLMAIGHSRFSLVTNPATTSKLPRPAFFARVLCALVADENSQRRYHHFEREDKPRKSGSNSNQSDKRSCDFKTHDFLPCPDRTIPHKSKNLPCGRLSPKTEYVNLRSHTFSNYLSLVPLFTNFQHCTPAFTLLVSSSLTLAQHCC